VTPTRRRSLVLGLLAGLLVLALFGWLVGYRGLAATVASLDPLPFALGFFAAAGAVACRFLALAALLDVRPRLDAGLAYLRGFYGQQLLPVGNVAGPLLIADSMETATGISTDGRYPGRSSHRPRRSSARPSSPCSVCDSARTGSCSCSAAPRRRWPRPDGDPALAAGREAIWVESSRPAA
jgi:hypothetical protein